MQSKITRRLVLSALFTALICVVTYFAFPVPSLGGGYINAGDAVIYCAAIAMGNPWAGLAAGLGSALADIFTGFYFYWPGTLIIKGCMGLIVGIAFGKQVKWKYMLGLMSAAAAIMIIGYSLYQYILYILSSSGIISIGGVIDNPFSINAIIWQSPIAWNLVQGVFGVAVGLPLAMQMKRLIPRNLQDTFQKK